jgi:hypothetical protein
MREALEATRGIQSQAAELLSMPKRTFFARMKQYGISRQPTPFEPGSSRIFPASDHLGSAASASASVATGASDRESHR